MDDSTAAELRALIDLPTLLQQHADALLFAEKLIRSSDGAARMIGYDLKQILTDE